MCFSNPLHVIGSHEYIVRRAFSTMPENCTIEKILTDVSLGSSPIFLLYEIFL